MHRLMEYLQGFRAKQENNDHAVCAFITPTILAHVAVSQDVSEEVRESAQSTLDAGSGADKERQDVSDGDKNPHEPELPDPDSDIPPPPGPEEQAPEIQDAYAPVNIYDGKNSPYAKLPGPLARGYGKPAVNDYATDSCYHRMYWAREFFRRGFGWNSIDDKNMPIVATVRYGWNVANAYFMFKENQMVFGRGNPDMYNFTASFDVVGHELTHGIIQHSSGLLYKGMSGALNESCSDVMGALLEQWARQQTAETADWLLAQDVLFPKDPKIAMRSMKAPGTAYDDPKMGKDNQPAHMKDYVNTKGDNGGVHINSGIPNRAFYLAAAAHGGQAFLIPGKTWFAAMTTAEPNETFVAFANRTIKEAKRLGDEKWVNDVTQAWITVGVLSKASNWVSRWWYTNAV